MMDLSTWLLCCHVPRFLRFLALHLCRKQFPTTSPNAFGITCPPLLNLISLLSTRTPTLLSQPIPSLTTPPTFKLPVNFFAWKPAMIPFLPLETTTGWRITSVILKLFLWITFLLRRLKTTSTSSQGKPSTPRCLKTSHVFIRGSSSSI